jgi:hypothetical protein
VEQGIQPLEQSIRLDPRDPSIVYRYNWLGLAHLLQSHPDEAIVWFDKARGAMPAASLLTLFLPPPMASKAIPNAPPPVYWSMAPPKTLALLEATLFAGLRKAGVPEE